MNKELVGSDTTLIKYLQSMTGAVYAIPADAKELLVGKDGMEKGNIIFILNGEFKGLLMFANRIFGEYIEAGMLIPNNGGLFYAKVMNDEYEVINKEYRIKTSEGDTKL